MKPYPTCNYIFTRGTYCLSPAMRDQQFCYFHSRDHQRKRNLEEARSLKTSDHYSKYPEQRELLDPEIIESLDIPSLDDGPSIQVAATNIIRAILSGHVSEKRGGLALYGLQVAAGNLKRVNTRIYESELDRVPDVDPDPIKPLLQFPELYSQPARPPQQPLPSGSQLSENIVPHPSHGERGASAASREHNARVQPLAAEPWNEVGKKGGNEQDELKQVHQTLDAAQKLISTKKQEQKSIEEKKPTVSPSPSESTTCHSEQREEPASPSLPWREKKPTSSERKQQQRALVRPVLRKVLEQRKAARQSTTAHASASG